MKKKKVVIKAMMTGNPFFKTPDEVAKLFGFPTSIRSKIKFMGRFSGKEIKLSDRSLDNLSGKGLPEQTVKETFEPILEVFEELFNVDFENLTPDGTQITDIPMLWRAIIKGALSVRAQHPNASQVESCIRPMVAFIDRRSREYKPQQEWLDRHKGMSEIEVLPHLEDFCKLLLDKTMLNAKQRAILLQLFNRCVPNKNFEVKREDEGQAVALFSQDFNMSLFAALDRVAINFKQSEQSEPRHQESYLAQIFTEDGKCYFDRFIVFIKKKSGFSYNKIAECIPVTKKVTASGRTQTEAKIERLKEWRKGKTKPSFTVMREFFLNFAFEDQCPLLICSYICLAIDRELASIKSKSDRAFIKEVYSADNYLMYFEKEKCT